MIDLDRAIARWSFNFRAQQVAAVSLAGCPYRREVWVGMPALPPDLMKSSFYLYKTRSDAKNGVDYGGTGFFVGVPSKVDSTKFHTIAISNWHVAVDGYPIIRVNKRSGGTDILEFDPSEWVFKPKWYDIAAVPVKLDDAVHDVTTAIDTLLLSEDTAKEYDIGPGDDVFMVGRFMDHDGGKMNEPAARFGHISMTPTAIKQPTKSMLESYVIDVHSRTGYSGFPVFVYRTIVNNLNHLFTATSDKFHKPKVVQFLYILGIMWGYFPELWEITKNEKTRKSSAKGLAVIGQYIEGMSGMSCVVPSWAIRELLGHRKIQNFIDQEEQKLRDRGLPAKPA
jgi:hypothetical protein